MTSFCEDGFLGVHFLGPIRACDDISGRNSRTVLHLLFRVSHPFIAGESSILEILFSSRGSCLALPASSLPRLAHVIFSVSRK